MSIFDTPLIEIAARWGDLTPEEMTRAADALGLHARYSVKSETIGEARVRVFRLRIELGDRWHHSQVAQPLPLPISWEETAVGAEIVYKSLHEMIGPEGAAAVVEKAREMFRQ